MFPARMGSCSIYIIKKYSCSYKKVLFLGSPGTTVISLCIKTTAPWRLFLIAIKRANSAYIHAEVNPAVTNPSVSCNGSAAYKCKPSPETWSPCWPDVNVLIQTRSDCPRINCLNSVLDATTYSASLQAKSL